MDDLDKLLLGFSHPIRRAKLGQEGWTNVKKTLMELAHAEGKDLPDYFEEEEVMDLDRANLHHGEQDNPRVKGE